MAEYKDVSDLKKQISDFKKAVFSSNSDYLTWYVCALSATEGIIAGLPDADVVEVVRCKDCKWYQIRKWDDRYPKYDCRKTHALLDVKPEDFCSYGERKVNDRH